MSFAFMIIYIMHTKWKVYNQGYYLKSVLLNDYQIRGYQDLDKYDLFKTYMNSLSV